MHRRRQPRRAGAAAMALTAVAGIGTWAMTSSASQAAVLPPVATPVVAPAPPVAPAIAPPAAPAPPVAMNGTGTTTGVGTTAACADVDLIFAKGAGETGTLGNIVGDEYFAAMQRYLTTQLTTTQYVVNYPALNDAQSVSTGAVDLIAHYNAQLAACPAQRFVLIGYSEGASVVDTVLGVNHQAAANGVISTHILSTMAQAHLSSIVVFSNPIGVNNRLLALEAPKALSQRVFDFCETTDPVCRPGATDKNAHLQYTADGKADEGAALSSRQLLMGG